MTIVYSTGAVNYKAGEGSTRKMFEDCVLDIYSGTMPVTADEAPGNTKLCRCTLAHGAVVSTDRSTPKVGKFTVVSHGSAQSFKVLVTLAAADGSTTATYSYIASTDHTLPLISRRLARILNDIPQLLAIGDNVATVYVQHRIAGQSFTIADGGSTTVMTFTSASLVTAARVNTIQFGPPTAGVISKTSDVWSGTNLATGVAGFFRFVLPDDTGVLNYTDVRAQGTIATSGADLNMSNTTLTVSAITTIDTASIKIPKTA